MTTLTDTLFSFYAYTQADIDDLAKRLEERRRATWINTLTELARKHGCGQLPGTPKGEFARHLKRLSVEDAQHIANTYNRELLNQVNRIFKSNPRANRNTYAKQLGAWIARRDAYKTYQIGLQTDSTARQYAQAEFYRHNPKIAPKFRYSPIPPVSKECIKRTRKGAVSLKYVLSHPTPAHINCPHTWLPQSPKQADCELLWLG